MQGSEITRRFLACVDQLIADKQVNSRRHFALTLKYHAQGISEMVGERRDVPLELIEKAVKHFRFNATFLFTGIGPKFLDPKTEEDVRIRNLGIVTNEKGEERILHVPVPAQAGYGRLHDDAEFMRELPSYQLPDPQFKSGTYRSFEVEGSSMVPTFRPTDIVIASYIEPRYWEQAIKSGQAYIIVTKQDVYLKRVNNFLKKDKVLECYSDNEETQTFPIEVDAIREIWRPRMKITSYLDPQQSMDNNHLISSQLKAQKQMLEELKKQLSHVVPA